MNIQALMKREEQSIKENKECMVRVRNLKAEVEKMNLEIPLKEGKCPLLKIAGFAEIGSVDSNEIDRDIYEL